MTVLPKYQQPNHLGGWFWYQNDCLITYWGRNVKFSILTVNCQLSTVKRLWSTDQFSVVCHQLTKCHLVATFLILDTMYFRSKLCPASQLQKNTLSVFDFVKKKKWKWPKSDRRSPIGNYDRRYRPTGASGQMMKQKEIVALDQRYNLHDFIRWTVWSLELKPKLLPTKKRLIS